MKGDQTSPPTVMLTPTQVASLLGVHMNTVKRTPPSELPYFTVGSRGDRRYRPEDVQAYIDARTVSQ